MCFFIFGVFFCGLFSSPPVKNVGFSQPVCHITRTVPPALRSKPRPDRDAVLQGQLIDVLEDIREIECRAQLTGVRPTKQERSRCAACCEMHPPSIDTSNDFQGFRELCPE